MFNVPCTSYRSGQGRIILALCAVQCWRGNLGAEERCGVNPRILAIVPQTPSFSSFPTGTGMFGVEEATGRDLLWMPSSTFHLFSIFMFSEVFLLLCVHRDNLWAQLGLM